MSRAGSSLSTVADVLDVKVPDDCDSAKSLTEMIVQKVMESANSVLNANADNLEEVYRCITPPNRLGVMVSHACDMLKAFLAKMKGIFRLPERKESQEALIEENSSLGDPKAVAENLFEKVWAKMEGEDFEITPEIFMNIDKVVYKELCKQWDGAKRVLVIVNEGEQLADDVVASIFKYHLTNQPKKRGAVGRFFHGEAEL
ncbi:putative transcriptional regulatory protein C11D3.07c [Dissostichus eleginoides]|uniref:Transcriptional regulatory protein C11D3.07c n=1 Tax=Dissostichus eleginoides TaxID=100907 RepID=A0AAD9F8X9_DISEL|nr:putative transcriptional regulatory protein C11D3.07c [Dissostichus eleginoides]